MTTESVSPQRLAMLLHHYSQALAPDFGVRPSPDSEWESLSPNERGRMVAAAELTLLDLHQAAQPASPLNLPFPKFEGGTEGKECGA